MIKCENCVHDGMCRFLPSVAKNIECRFYKDKTLFVELRKMRPMLKVPFPGYIYETAKNGGRGMVVGEFICDQIYAVAKDISRYDIGDDILDYFSEAKEKGLDMCLSDYELNDYLKNGFGYGIHITKLVRYPDPICIKKFSKLIIGSRRPLERPPQSWCYVEE